MNYCEYKYISAQTDTIGLLIHPEIKSLLQNGLAQSTRFEIKSHLAITSFAIKET